MDKKTVLYSSHIELKAKMFSFSGWTMPLCYQSQLKEHCVVRTKAGMFDVSHMQLIEIKGSGAYPFLRYVLANDIKKILGVNKALYSCLLNERGGIIDDLIVYHIDKEHYYCVVNAGTYNKVLAWFQRCAGEYDVSIKLKENYGILALQGPEFINAMTSFFPESFINELKNLKKFHYLFHNDVLVSKTGYTGEDGVEIMLDKCELLSLWKHLLTQGVQPCGLGARDTLRLEAGYNLSGVDMDESITPMESNLSWTVTFNDERYFIGKQALLKKMNQTNNFILVGLVFNEKRILRNHQKIKTEEGQFGVITSGSYSPTLEQSIAFARIPRTSKDYCWVDLRGVWKKCAIVKLPFLNKKKTSVVKGG